MIYINNMLRVLFLIILAHCSPQIFCQKTILSGNAPDYANQNLTIYKHTDYITNNKKIVKQALVQPNGDFNFEIDINQTEFFFIPLGIYKGIIYLEPFNQYTIQLPQKTNKSPQQERDPFFQEQSIYLSIINKINNKKDTLSIEDDINQKIFAFNTHYDSILFFSVRRNYSSKIIDSIANNLAQPFEPINNEYFKAYCETKKKHFLYVLKRIHPQHLAIKQIISDSSTLYFNIPAFGDLINLIYNKHFNMLATGKNSTQFHRIFEKDTPFASIDSFFLQQTKIQSDNPRHLSILSSCYGSLTTGIVSSKKIISLIDSITYYNTNKDLKTIAEQIKIKASHLTIGTPAPFIDALYYNDKPIDLKEFEGEYILINFCSLTNNGCIRDFITLNDYQKRFGDRINILTVLIADEKEEANKFQQINQYNWKFAYASHPSELNEIYNIKTMPLYYLIDKDGTIQTNKCPSPSEMFEVYFYNLLKSRKEIKYNDPSKFNILK
jgi:peroxiredoxin